jgi:hypothetical protein
MSEPPVRTQDAFVPLTKAQFRERFRNAVRSLATQVTQIRTGAWHAPDESLREPREK